LLDTSRRVPSWLNELPPIEIVFMNCSMVYSCEGPVRVSAGASAWSAFEVSADFSPEQAPRAKSPMSRRAAKEREEIGENMGFSSVGVDGRAGFFEYGTYVKGGLRVSDSPASKNNVNRVHPNRGFAHSCE
jgi:hypothetical protein